MSLIINWQGRDYNVDPADLNQRELDLIHQRTGLTWGDLVTGGLRPDPNAVRALFWIVDQRTKPDLQYSAYDGPPMGLWLRHIAGYRDVVQDLGKLMTEAFGGNGSAASPSDADTPPISTTA